MDRRAVIAGTLGLLATPRSAGAQPARVYRVALVFGAAPVSEMAGPEPSHPIIRAFVRELRALGYVEGQNLVLERRSAVGNPERLPAIMAELIRLPVDVIVTGVDAATRAAKQATSTIPIVMGISSSPVELGFAASLARPGGNVTGLTWNAGPENAGKWLEPLKGRRPRGLAGRGHPPDAAARRTGSDQIERRAAGTTPSSASHTRAAPGKSMS